VIIHTIGDRSKNVAPAVVHVEGDPDHPISRGTLCPKGASLRDDINNPNRLTSPKVRRPGSDHWEDVTWDEAITQIARHVKDTRDRTLVEKNAKGEVVNRTPGIAWIGGCTDTNEFNFLQWKALTAWGVPYRDTQARV
jgi:formate dehydrogenase major subunit